MYSIAQVDLSGGPVRLDVPDAADPQKRANWLPAPDGDFRPILRMYEPGEAVFDGRYELPPITKSP